MVREEEAESRKKLDEQKKKELRDIEKFLCVPKEFQESLKSNLQPQLQEVEPRRHDLMPDNQKVQKRSQKYKTSRIKEEFCRKTVPHQKRRCESSTRSSSKKKSVYFSVEQSRLEQDGGCRNGGRTSEFAGRRRKKRQ